MCGWPYAVGPRDRSELLRHTEHDGFEQSLAEHRPWRNGFAGRVFPHAAAVRFATRPASSRQRFRKRSIMRRLTLRAIWPLNAARIPHLTKRVQHRAFFSSICGESCRKTRSVGTRSAKRSRRTGCGISLMIAIAPTATIASIAGCYECIEPQVSNLFKRETLSGDFVQINKYLVSELKAAGPVDRRDPQQDQTERRLGAGHRRISGRA